MKRGGSWLPTVSMTSKVAMHIPNSFHIISGYELVQPYIGSPVRVAVEGRQLICEFL